MLKRSLTPFTRPSLILDLDPVISQFIPGPRCEFRKMYQQVPGLLQVLMRLTPQEIILCEFISPSTEGHSKIIYEYIECNYPELIEVIEREIDPVGKTTVDIIFDSIIQETDIYLRNYFKQHHLEDYEDYVIERWLGKTNALFVHAEESCLYDKLILKPLGKKREKHVPFHQRY